MKSPFLIAGLAAWLALAAVAPATAQQPVVTFHMDLSVPGEFSLFASSSLDDNFGISCYGLPFDEATAARITSLDHLSPVSNHAENAAGLAGTAGFSTLRSDLNLPGIGLTIFAGQNTISPTPHLIRGFGQSAGSLSDLGLAVLGQPVQPQWDSSLLLARGTYTGDANDFRLNTNSSDLVANVFASTTGRDVLERRSAAHRFDRILVDQTAPAPASSAPTSAASTTPAAAARTNTPAAPTAAGRSATAGESGHRLPQPWNACTAGHTHNHHRRRSRYYRFPNRRWGPTDV